MIGKTVGHYRILSKLGAGGTGSVWLAEDTLLGRPVALKLLAVHLATSDLARQRFLTEARAASRLEHPNIATVYEAGESNGENFIAYQRIEGDTLARRLATGPIPLPELLRLAQGCAEALEHAHERDVLHRDLTAGNVMLRPDGSPVIVDFGLARLRGETALTSTGTTMGTAPYLAPEQWRGAPTDAKTDLWSLGVVLYFAATGRLPFGEESSEAVLQAVLNDDPVRPTKLRGDLPPEFERLVMRLLEKDPMDRPASAASVAAAVRSIAGGGEEFPSYAESSWAGPRRRWRKLLRTKFGPAQIALLMTGVLVLVAVATVLVRRLPDRHELVVAVLPFRNASADPEDTGYIGEALGSELTAQLGRMGGFRVLPWETTARFGDSKRSFSELARDLGADVLLVGHFEGDDEHVSVELELVEGRNGLQRWSDKTQSAIHDLARLQSELASRIAHELAPAVDGSRAGRTAARLTQNPEAYETYLRGVNSMHSNLLADRALAEPMFRHALDLDSSLAEAWVGLGAVLIDRYYQGGSGGLEDLARGRSSFEKALALDPGSGPAIRGLIRVLTETEGTTEQGLALADSAGPRVSDEIERELVRGWACTFGSLPGEANDAFQRVLTLDPHNQAARYMSTFTLWWDGRPAEAVDNSKAYVREFGEDPDVYAYCGAALAATGRYEEAKVFLQRSMRLFSGSSGAFAALYYAGVLRSSGASAAAETFLDERIPSFEAALAAAPDNLRLRTDLANLYVLRGDMARFDAQWSIVRRELDAGTPGSGGEYAYTPFVLAQMGKLERAREALLTFPRGLGQFGVLLPANVGLQEIFHSGSATEFASSSEVLLVRSAEASLRASLRTRYPWLAGTAGEPIADTRQARLEGSAR